VNTHPFPLNRSWIENLFAPYLEQIGSDYLGYRNHVYRTVTYAMLFLGESSDAERTVETAMVYHDIGLWSDRKLAYLEPSETLCLADNEKNGWGLNPELLRGIIHWHHKITPYRGPHREIIEACRKADWVDATKGWFRKGIPRSVITSVEEAFPNHGFHESLLRLSRDIGGSTLVGGFQVARGILKW